MKIFATAILELALLYCVALGVQSLGNERRASAQARAAEAAMAEARGEVLNTPSATGNERLAARRVFEAENQVRTYAQENWVYRGLDVWTMFPE